MKIENSSIAMASGHSCYSYTHTESMTMQAAKSSDLPGAILMLSEKSKDGSFVDGMKEYKKQKEEEAAQQRENQQKNLRNLLQMQRAGKAKGPSGAEISDKMELKLEMLRKMLEALRVDKGGKKTTGSEEKSQPVRSQGVIDLRSGNPQPMTQGALSRSVGTTSSGTVWQKVTAISGFSSEFESTSFATVGKVQTADGRSIDFNMELSMSRAFTSKIDILSTEDYILTDPLMINLDTDLPSVTDQKFLFDLDSDGKEEEMSFAGKGSGFLALDKNGDGKINDGSELFGTKSGDGFKDLAAYDEDGNGWIDENDSIFSQLKVWTKDEHGNDILLDLKKADVGAIYLGSADTEFALKNDRNQTNGVLRKTGVFLHESTGAAGTVSHVDLAV